MITLYAMPSLREIKDILLFAHNDNLISEEEFLLLYDLNESNNLELPYWSYDRFDLDLLTDDECKSEFRFYKRDVHLLAKCCRFRIKYDAITVLLSMGSKLSVIFLNDLHMLVDILICCQGLQDLSLNFV